MEADLQATAASPEAPPGDSAPPPAADAGAGPEAIALADDLSNFEEWAHADAERINAEAEAAEQAADRPPVATATAEDAPPPAASSEPVAEPKPAAPASQQSDFDEAAALQRLMERGYKVEAPPPPPDPYADLAAQLNPLVGTPEQYEDAKARATAPVPPEPDQYAADYDEQMTAYRAAVKSRNDAAAELARFDLGRTAANVALPWAERRVLGQIGTALQGVPAKYGLDEAHARRVTNPTAMTDAIDAVAEQINGQWQAKYDARERYWQGEVSRAKSDAAAENVQRMGRQPQATPTPGGRTGPVEGLLFEVDPKTGVITEESIQRAIRGDFAHADLSDR